MQAPLGSAHFLMLPYLGILGSGAIHGVLVFPLRLSLAMFHRHAHKSTCCRELLLEIPFLDNNPTLCQVDKTSCYVWESLLYFKGEASESTVTARQKTQSVSGLIHLWLESYCNPKALDRCTPKKCLHLGPNSSNSRYSPGGPGREGWV